MLIDDLAHTVEEKLTWNILHDRYEKKALTAGVRVISFSHWRQMVNYFFPGLKVSRTKEDVCDACMRIETQLLNPDISEEQRQQLQLEKAVHLDAAIEQRHKQMSNFVKLFVKGLDPRQVLPDPILPDCIHSGLQTLEKATEVSTDLNKEPTPIVWFKQRILEAAWHSSLWI